MSGIIYILTNPTIPNLVKIGKTEQDLESKMKQLSSAPGVPVAFECFYACEVEDYGRVETKIHDAFGDHRVNPRREFFRINPERVKSVLELLAVKDVTPGTVTFDDKQEEEAFKKEQKRRERFNFEMLEILPGEILYWYRDDSITAKVVDKRNIEFEGKIMTASAAAGIILERKGFSSTSVAGTYYWSYKGELLYERRARLEDNTDDSE